MCLVGKRKCALMPYCMYVCMYGGDGLEACQGLRLYGPVEACQVLRLSVPADACQAVRLYGPVETCRV